MLLKKIALGMGISLFLLSGIFAGVVSKQSLGIADTAKISPQQTPTVSPTVTPTASPTASPEPTPSVPTPTPANPSPTPTMKP